MRIALVAHGDYFDKELTYVIKMEDFSTDPKQLSEFIYDMGDTSGGDWEECYELVLRQVRKKLSVCSTEKSAKRCGSF